MFHKVASSATWESLDQFAETRHVAVGAALPGVLRGGLAVHLQHAAPGLAEHPADDVDVVHLHGRLRRLVGLVKPLQHSGKQPLRAADDPCCLAELHHRDVTDVGHPLQRILAHPLGQLVIAHQVALDVVGVDPAVGDDLVQDAVHQRHIGSGFGRQMHRRQLRHRRRPRVHADHLRRVGPGEAVEDARPQDRLRLGHIVPVQGDDVGMVDVGVGAGLSVAAEGLLQRRRRGCRTQPGVAVHMVGTETAVRDHSEGVVLLQEQLPRGVEADGAGPLLVEQLLGAGDDPLHRRVPVGFHQLAVDADQRTGQPVRRCVGLPAEQILRPEAPAVHPVIGSPPHTDNLLVAHRDIHGVAVGVHDRRRLHPPVDVRRGGAFLQVGVHPYRPLLARPVRGPGAPRLGDSVRAGHAVPPMVRRFVRFDVLRFCSSTQTCGVDAC